MANSPRATSPHPPMPAIQQEASQDHRSARAAVSTAPTDSTAPHRHPEGRRRTALALSTAALALALGACSKTETPAPSAPPPAKVGVKIGRAHV